MHPELPRRTGFKNCVFCESFNSHFPPINGICSSFRMAPRSACTQPRAALHLAHVSTPPQEWTGFHAPRFIDERAAFRPPALLVASLPPPFFMRPFSVAQVIPRAMRALSGLYADEVYTLSSLPFREALRRRRVFAGDLNVKIYDNGHAAVSGVLTLCVL